MCSNRLPPPLYPGKSTIALVGKRIESNNFFGNIILSTKAFVTLSSSLFVAENTLFKVINSCGFFDEKIQSLDQQVLDFIAVSQPGPHLFILVIESEDTREDEVMAQINKLQNIFGEEVTTNLVVLLPDFRICHSLDHVGKHFNIEMVVATENLPSECEKWCSARQPFPCREAAVTVKKTDMGIIRDDDVPPSTVYPGKPTIALVGKRMESNDFFGNMILSTKVFVTLSSSLFVAENTLFKVINACDFFDEKIQSLDQQVLDFIAVSQPGPHLFILVIESEDTREDEVVAQINKLQNIFGEEVTTNLVVLLPDLRSCHSLYHVGKQFNIEMVVATENLPSECEKWCSARQPFPCSEAAVTVKKTDTGIRRDDDVPPSTVYPGKSTIALIGKRMESKNFIGNMIFSTKAFVTLSSSLFVAENTLFKVINTCDFFDEKIQSLDQQVLDFIAVSQPGPHLFILVIESEDTREEEVVAQINKLQNIFGEGVTTNLVVLLPDLRSCHSLDHVGKRFNIEMALATENLPSECEKWCSARQLFPCSEAAVTVKKTDTGIIRDDDVPPSAGMSTNAVIDNIFNIVLLGLSGTGKSSSANTILALEKCNPPQRFKCEASFMPVTTHCEVKIMQKPFDIQVRVVDTPDFIHDTLQISQEQINECKTYCRPGSGIILLVIQLGRFTDAERGIVEKLEKKLGLSIRETTIVLLTHGEDLKGTPEELIRSHVHLKHVIELCGRRYHLFNNKSKNPKQVLTLIEKIPHLAIYLSEKQKKKIKNSLISCMSSIC